MKAQHILNTVGIKEIVNISLQSSKAKEGMIRIYEKSELSEIIGLNEAEKIRKSFLENETKVKQITNVPTLDEFTQNNEFTNTCMTFRFIPKKIYNISNEVLIFDDIVAIYNIEPEPKLLIIENLNYANNQKQLFDTLWEEGLQPKLNFKYEPNHSFYNSIDFQIKGIQVIIWPDKDAKEAYSGMNYQKLKKYLHEILKENWKIYKDSDYIVGFIWNYEGDRKIDIWKFDTNYVDDRSGPLSEAKIYRNQKECTDLGLASGNTLLVLGYEEKLRRQKNNLSDYLEGPPPSLPLELLNGEDFFKSDNET